MSVLSYARVRCPLDEAMVRYGRWIGAAEVSPPRQVREEDAVELALEDEEWLGLAVFIYSSGPWTVLEEISGGLASRSAESWLELAQDGDLVHAGYNDAVPYAELLVVEQGRLMRRILRDEQDPGEDVDIGQLPEEAVRRLSDWTDVMTWVEADAAKLERPGQGILWIHEADWDT